MSTSPDVPLSRAEVIWAQIVEVQAVVADAIREANGVETRIESSITTLEMLLRDLDTRSSDVRDSSVAIVQQREEEIRVRLEEATRQMLVDLQRRDLKVTTDITDAVANELDVIIQALRSTLNETIAKEVSKGARDAKAAWQDTGRRKWLAIAITTVSLACAASALGAWLVASKLLLAGHQERVDLLVKSGRGDAALKLAEFNDLEAMVTCRGFKKVEQQGHTYCVPLSDDKKMFGWRIQ